MMRRRVVLPQPLGPTSVKSSPGRTSRLTPSMASVSPNRLTMFLDADASHEPPAGRKRESEA